MVGKDREQGVRPLLSIDQLGCSRRNAPFLSLTGSELAGVGVLLNAAEQERADRIAGE
jgi:hypothetical protein